MRLSEEDLWCDVSWRAALGGEGLPVHDGGKAKVHNLHIRIVICVGHQQVLGFEVPDKE